MGWFAKSSQINIGQIFGFCKAIAFFGNNKFVEFGAVAAKYSEKYGDFIIWKQVLDFAKAKSCPIILVTRDSKDDWWTKKEGKIVSPHLELRREFHEQVQQSFWMYQTQRFYEIANDKLGVELNPRSIEEANAVAEENIAEETVYEKLLEVIQQDQKSSLLESISKLSDLSQARPELLSSLISKSLIDENTLKSIQNLAKKIIEK